MTDHDTPHAVASGAPACTKAEAEALEAKLVAAFAQLHRDMAPARALFERACQDQRAVRRLVKLACETGGYESLRVEEVAASGQFLLDALETVQTLVAREGERLGVADWARLREHVHSLDEAVAWIGQWRVRGEVEAATAGGR